MTAVKTVPVENTRGEVTDPFWPPKRKRVVVIFEALDDRFVVARGLDLDNNEVVFKAKLRTRQQDAFIKAVTDGATGQLLTAVASNENTTLQNGTVVITGTGTGDGPGPKVWIPGPKYWIDLPQ